jgi:addiction module RelB/DinJ family antitoxin
MNTAVIITKTEPEVKRRAQAVVKEFGISLSSLINAYLKQIVRTKKIEFTLDEEPSEYLKKTIKQALADRKKGKASPVFNTGKEAVKWLESQGI